MLTKLICGYQEEEIQKLLQELEQNGVLSKLPDGTIINRRMYFEEERKQEISDRRKEAINKRWHKQKRYKNDTKGNTKPIQLPNKDKDIDKDKDINKEKEVVGEKEFEIVWNKYPRRIGRREAYRHFQATVKTPEDLRNIKTALENFLTYHQNAGTKPQFIPHGSTWFNQWLDWVNYQEPAGNNGQEILNQAMKELSIIGGKEKIIPWLRKVPPELWHEFGTRYCRVWPKVAYAPHNFGQAEEIVKKELETNQKKAGALVSNLAGKLGVEK
jgi:hypothetical protein